MALFSEKVANLPELNKPHAIECDGEKFYIVDEATVHMYSMKDFKYIGSFGKRGDGPMELVPGRTTYIQLLLLKDKIILFSEFKLVMYTREGKPIDEKVFHNSIEFIVPFGKNYAIVQYDVDQKNPLIYLFTVMLLTPDFKTKKNLLSFERAPIGVKNKLGFAIPQFTFLSLVNNLLYVFDQQHDKEFMIFNTEGKQIKKLKVPLQGLKITESIKNEILDYMKKSRIYKSYGLKEENLKETVFFREYFPSVRVPKIKDGIIYIQTYEKKDGKYRFVLLNLKGKILKSLFLPVDVVDLVQWGQHTTYCFDKTNYYYLEDNADAETWELHKEVFTLNPSK